MTAEVNTNLINVKNSEKDNDIVVRRVVTERGIHTLVSFLADTAVTYCKNKHHRNEKHHSDADKVYRNQFFA